MTARDMVIDPGALRTELMLQQCAATPDDSGGLVESWSDVATLMACIEPQAAASRFGADQTLETTTHRIILRFRGDVASGMRFAKGVRIFTILTVHDPDERGRYLVCRVREAGL